MRKIAKIILLVVAVLVVGGIISGVVLGRKGKKPAYTFIIAERGGLVQEVNVTGKVKASQGVKLAFEVSGKITAVSVEIGDKAEAGQVLVRLDDTELKAQLSQAQAKLAIAEAELKELKRGAREEEIQVAQTKVANAEKSLADAEINLANVKNKAEIDLANEYDDVKDVLKDAYAKADDAVNKQIDELFSDDNTTGPKLTFSTAAVQAKIDSEAQRILARDALATFKSEVDNLSADYTSLDTALKAAQNHLNIISNLLVRVNDALNKALDLSQATANIYKGYVNTGRANVNTALSNINGQQQTIAARKALNQQNISTAEASVNNAKNALESAQKELIFKRAGATEEQIAALEGQVAAAKADVQNIQAKLAKTILLSPINGLVTQQDARVGEIAKAQTTVISLISEADLEIETNIPEVDIAKVKIGNTVKTTLDAHGDEVIFPAVVTSIDPAETIIEGVATYKTTLQFIEEDKRIKPGMTANIDILTAQKEDVILVPARAVITKDGEKLVRILVKRAEGEAIEEVPVTIGLRGSDGNVEITQGIQEGDKVITFLEEK